MTLGDVTNAKVQAEYGHCGSMNGTGRVSSTVCPLRESLKMYSVQGVSKNAILFLFLVGPLPSQLHS